MFHVDCPTLGTSLLIGPRRVLGVHAAPAGLTATLRCHCGALVAATGSEVHHPTAAAAAPAPVLVTELATCA